MPDDTTGVPRPVARITLRNRLDELGRLAIWAQQLPATFGYVADQSYRVELVLEETVTNIIQYAFDDERVHEIVVEAHYHPPELTLAVLDDGQPFSLPDAPAAALPQTLDDAHIGGLGIHLIRQYTTDIQYVRRAKQNQLVLRMTLPAV